LDASCGLGFKTVALARGGYEVEGSDQSAVAIKYATILAEEQGFKIRFFRSRFGELGRECTREYDCVYSDYFDELGTCGDLKASAAGVYSVLNREGKFIFSGPSPELERADLGDLIEREWRGRRRLNINPPYEKRGLRVIHIEVLDKTVDGILEQHLFIMEREGARWAEIASIMNPRIKWTFKDYENILKEVGFRGVEAIKKNENEVFVVAMK